jgi:hypothetical protein
MMAITNISAILPHPVVKMMESEHRFHLTGSRYFGNSTNQSDWDFFVQDSDGVRNWLDANGFKINKNSKYYSDGFCVDVYRLNITYYNWIDVQVVSDSVLKLKAQDLIKKTVPPSALENKAFARIVWRLALESLSTKG